ncbi:hypothetical protein Cfor_11816, partial [Coptotermes formosanus]
MPPAASQSSVNQRHRSGRKVSVTETCQYQSTDSVHLGNVKRALWAIFTEDQRDSSAELAFKYAVYRINKDQHILPRTTLVYDIQYVPRDDSFHASKKGGTPET